MAIYPIDVPPLHNPTLYQAAGDPGEGCLGQGAKTLSPDSIVPSCCHLLPAGEGSIIPFGIFSMISPSCTCFH